MVSILVALLEDKVELIMQFILIILFLINLNIFQKVNLEEENQLTIVLSQKNIMKNPKIFIMSAIVQKEVLNMVQKCRVWML